jgi:hypothetical protein
MNEELELYLDMLRGDLEVEVDLHGGRTEKSRTLRELIIYTERELASLKTQDDELFGECDHCGKPYLLCGDGHNTVTGNHFECEVLSQVV